MLGGVGAGGNPPGYLILPHLFTTCVPNQGRTTSAMYRQYSEGAIRNVRLASAPAKVVLHFVWRVRTRVRITPWPGNRRAQGSLSLVTWHMTRTLRPLPSFWNPICSTKSPDIFVKCPAPASMNPICAATAQPVEGCCHGPHAWPCPAPSTLRVDPYSWPIVFNARSRGPRNVAAGSPVRRIDGPSHAGRSAERHLSNVTRDRALHQPDIALSVCNSASVAMSCLVPV